MQGRCSIKLPLEALKEQVDRSIEELQAELDRAKRDGRLPPVYTEDPSVLAATPEETIFPAGSFDALMISLTCAWSFSHLVKPLKGVFKHFPL